MTNVFTLPKKFWGVAESKFYLRPLSFSSTSSYTGQRTPYGPVSQVWCCDLTLPNTEKSLWRELSGIVTRQRGISGLIRLPDSFRLRPSYDDDIETNKLNSSQPWSDETLFSDGSGWEEGYLPTAISAYSRSLRGENSIVVQSLPASTVRALRLGDLFEIRQNAVASDFGQIYEITQDANTDADGKTRIYFEPPLRAGVGAGDEIVLREPMSVFRFASETEGMITRDSAYIGSLGFSFIEELPHA